MKKVFIVNKKDGVLVVTRNVLQKALKEQLEKSNLKVKNVIVESFVDEAMSELSGKSLMQEEFNNMLIRYAVGIGDYAKMTPFRYYMDVYVNSNYPEGCAALGYVPNGYTEEQIRQ